MVFLYCTCTFIEISFTEKLKMREKNKFISFCNKKYKIGKQDGKDELALIKIQSSKLWLYLLNYWSTCTGGQEKCFRITWSSVIKGTWPSSRVIIQGHVIQDMIKGMWSKAKSRARDQGLCDQGPMIKSDQWHTVIRGCQELVIKRDQGPRDHGWSRGQAAKVDQGNAIKGGQGPLIISDEGHVMKGTWSKGTRSGARVGGLRHVHVSKGSPLAAQMHVGHAPPEMCTVILWGQIQSSRLGDKVDSGICLRSTLA